MLKRKILCSFLLLIMTACNSIVFAMDGYIYPYASIIAYASYNGGTPMNTLQTLDFINMTPWDISFGNASTPNTIMLSGMTTNTKQDTVQMKHFWLSGYNGSNWAKKANQPPSNTFTSHSKQMPLADITTVWVLDQQLQAGFSGNTYVSNPVPIVFNSQNGNTASTNVATLNFMATSSNGLSFSYDIAGSQLYPVTMPSFGDGNNNYGWATLNQDGRQGSGVTSPQHYLTIQASPAGNITPNYNGPTGSPWQPIVQNLGNVTSNPGTDGSAKGTPVLCPQYLTVNGLVYPNFSAVAGDGGNFDLVVILQAGNYVDMQLLFLAVPHSNDPFLKGSSASAVRR